MSRATTANYLFGLPPMLDGLPRPGKTTAAWLTKYGESVTGVRAGPWPGCVFREKIVYVHSSTVPCHRRRSQRSSCRQSTSLPRARSRTRFSGWSTIARSKSSPWLALARFLTAGKRATNGQIDLGQEMTFDRLEFTIENPGHRRGQGIAFELQAQQPDGAWRTLHRGQVFGSIYSKRFEPVTARFVRLNVEVPVREQFDLFDDK